MSQTQPLGPFKLVTVNTAPERARKIIGRIVEAVRDKYMIIHAANVEGEQNYASQYHNTGWMLTLGLPRTAIKDVGATVEEIKPDFLVRSPPSPNKQVLGVKLSLSLPYL